LLADLDWYINESGKDVTASDIMIEALVKLNTTLFDELVIISGDAEVLAALKPHRKLIMQSPINEVRKRMNIQSNGPDAMLLFYMFAGYGLAHGNLTGEVKERGGLGINYDCVFKDASPEFCMSLSHFCSEGVADFVNPEYECVWTHHMTNGDPYCRYIFKKKSDPISVLDDPGKTLATIPKLDLPKEQVQAMSIWAMSYFLDNTISVSIDFNGSKKTVEVLGAVAKNVGQQIGVELAKNNEDLTENALSLGRLIYSLQKVTGQKGNFTIIFNDEVTNEITDCTQQIRAFESCKVYESFFQGLTNSINPEYEFAYNRMMTKGDKTCHWTIRKKADSSNQMSKRGGVPDDPIKRLTNRFIDGEITKEEYEEKMAIIKKHYPR